MRKKRIFYFNDARHYYLFVFEPPIKIEDAWTPIDEISGTSVNSFSYGVERGDGMFYPSKVGMQFGTNIQPFDQAAYWRTWNNMQSLIDRGYDPLKLLIDRAHDKNLDFFASLRLGSYGGMDPSLDTKTGGYGYVNKEVRDHVYEVLKELVNDYDTDGIELDFAAPPGGASFYFQPEDVPKNTQLMTDWVKQVSDMTRNFNNTGKEIGARIYPTKAANEAAGLDIDEWIEQKLIDFVVPMVYGHHIIDPDMPIDWLIKSAHDKDISVYPMISPYYSDDSRTHLNRQYATPEMIRAATSNYWYKTVDGMYTWFLSWPLGNAEHRILSELGNPTLSEKGDKHYIVRRSNQYMEIHNIDCSLPLNIPSDSISDPHSIPFYISDNIIKESEKISSIELNINIKDLVSKDRLSFSLNGKSLSNEEVIRTPSDTISPYVGQWLKFRLKTVKPKMGSNTLQIMLHGRPEGLKSDLVVEDVEIIIRRGLYPASISS